MESGEKKVASVDNATPSRESHVESGDTSAAGALVGAYQSKAEARPRDWGSLRRWLAVDIGTWGSRIASPLGALTVAALLIVGVGGYALGSSMIGTSSPGTPSATAPSGSGMNMGGTSAQATTANVPNATQSQGGQLATYVLDKDGAKHFTFTAKQVMWEPVKGKRVLAWTLDGTVPGPTIRVTAGDHLRITINNHFPEGTSIHWHGLQVPSDQDGVPGIGQNPIPANQSYTYDFTVTDQDIGTHWYHSHYDDLTQVSGGLYGAFIIDPRPGSPQAAQAVHADVEYTDIVSELGGYFVISGKSFPDTAPINVKQGQTVLIRLIGSGEMIHPMHLHGHTFTIVAEDGHTLAQPIQKDTVQLAPGETYDLLFTAWAPPGSIYPFHCHILSHLMNPGQKAGEMGGLVQLVKYAK